MSENRPASRDAAYFEAKYAENPDPWNFKESAYEQHKYAATVAMLKGRHFSRGLEVGCSIGVLTKLLAKSCRELLAVDIAAAAIAQARLRCAGEPHVTVERMQVPQAWPAGSFDLIVFSEVLYFLSPDDIARTAALANASLMPGGVLLLVNYTEAIEEPCGGQEAAAAFIRNVLPVCRQVDRFQAKSFQMDLLKKQN